jgi:uncharacterized membrane protein (DUF4010 family)
MFGVTAALSLGLWGLSKRENSRMPKQKNPTEMMTALIFGVLFGVALLATAAAKKYFGAGGLYAVSVIAGLMDMDAITLSLAQMTNSSGIEPVLGWHLVLTASLSNLVFKTAVALVLGDKTFSLRVGGLFGIALILGGLLLAMWPT